MKSTARGPARPKLRDFDNVGILSALALFVALGYVDQGSHDGASGPDEVEALEQIRWWYTFM